MSDTKRKWVTIKDEKGNVQHILVEDIPSWAYELKKLEKRIGKKK